MDSFRLPLGLLLVESDCCAEPVGIGVSVTDKEPVRVGEGVREDVPEALEHTLGDSEGENEGYGDADAVSELRELPLGLPVGDKELEIEVVLQALLHALEVLLAHVVQVTESVGVEKRLPVPENVLMGLLLWLAELQGLAEGKTDTDPLVLPHALLVTEELYDSEGVPVPLCEKEGLLLVQCVVVSEPLALTEGD